MSLPYHLRPPETGGFLGSRARGLAGRKAMMTLASLAGLFVSGPSQAAPDGTAALAPAREVVTPESSRRGDLRIAYYVDSWDRADRGQIHAMLEAWAPGFTTPQYPKCNLQLIEEEDALAAAVRLDKFDAVFIYAYQMPTLGARLQLAPGLLVGSEDSPQLNLVLLARRNAGIDGIGDLAGKSIFLDTANLGALPGLWLGQTSKKAGNPTGLQARLGLCTDSFNAIAPVFFGTADACVTSQLGFSENAGLNPQVLQQLFVVATSPAFTTRVLTFPPNVDRSKKSAILALRPSLKGDEAHARGFLSSSDLVFHDVAEGDFAPFRSLDRATMPPLPGETLSGPPTLSRFSETTTLPTGSD